MSRAPFPEHIGSERGIPGLPDQGAFFEGFVRGREYDTVTSLLPEGTALPAGATGADLLAALPAGAADALPAELRADVATWPTVERASIPFDAILGTVRLLVALYMISALLGYVQA